MTHLFPSFTPYTVHRPARSLREPRKEQERHMATVSLFKPDIDAPLEVRWKKAERAMGTGAGVVLSSSDLSLHITPAEAEALRDDLTRVLDAIAAAGDPADALVARMTHAMVDAFAKTGLCTGGDLTDAGFTPRAIADHSDAAANRAAAAHPDFRFERT